MPSFTSGLPDNEVGGGAAASGVMAALRVLGGSSYAVVGLGHVGADIAGRLLAAGHRVLVTDIDERRRALVPGAEWATPDAIRDADVDVLVPAALGGLLTPATVPRLRCRAVAGPANNQLDAPATAGLHNGPRTRCSSSHAATG